MHAENRDSLLHLILQRAHEHLDPVVVCTVRKGRIRGYLSYEGDNVNDVEVRSRSFPAISKSIALRTMLDGTLHIGPIPVDDECLAVFPLSAVGRSSYVLLPISLNDRTLFLVAGCPREKTSARLRDAIVHLGYEAASSLAELILRKRSEPAEQVEEREEMVRSGISHHLKLPFHRLHPVSEQPSRPDPMIVGGGQVGERDDEEETATQWPVPISDEEDEGVIEDGGVIADGAAAPADGAAAPADGAAAPVEGEAAAPGDEAPRDAEVPVLHPRFPIMVEVDESSQHNFFAGAARDRESTGIFVATYSPVAVGDRFELVFSLPGVQGFQLALCEVVWTHNYDRDEPDAVPGMGLRFINLEEAVWRAIEGFIQGREPIAFEL